MNIFVLDKDPELAALYSCDLHVVKMSLETAQILSTVHHLRNSSIVKEIYKPTHQKHPCVLWANECSGNYEWLVELFEQLEYQYESRYHKKHSSYLLLYKYLKNKPLELPNGPLTTFVLAMPEKYRTDDPVISYRDYYIGEKSRFAIWTSPATVPEWFIQLKEK